MSPLSLLASTDPVVFGVREEVLSVMRPDGELEEVPVQRYVESDAGMTFPLSDLSERLYAANGPWPDAFPFPPDAFKREDEADDEDFYSMPRFCYHIDEGAVRAITNYYKSHIADGSSVLDICSSWVSHFPADFPAKMARIAGSGMNALELEQNEQLSDFSPKNLNVDPTLPYEDESFDVVTCVVSVDYLIQPIKVFKEVNRVLKPGGKFILSQSNRCFPSKAITMWLAQNDLEHCLVVAAYFHYSKGWTRPKIYDASPSGPRTSDPVFIVEASKGSAEPPKLDASRWLKKKKPSGPRMMAPGPRMMADSEAADIEERLAKEILAQKASNSDWTPSMLAGMETDLARVNQLRAEAGDSGLPETAGFPRHGREPWGTWSHGSDISLELYVDAATRGKDVRVECLVGFLDVRCNDVPLLSGRLAQQVVATDLEWTLDELDDGKRVLCLLLPKRQSGEGLDEAPVFTSLRVGGAKYEAPGLVA